MSRALALAQPLTEGYFDNEDDLDLDPVAAARADLARARRDTPRLVGQRICDEDVRWARTILHKTGLVAWLTPLLAGMLKGPGGIARRVTVEQFLIAMFLAAFEDQVLQFRVLTNILAYRLSPEMRLLLGLGAEPNENPASLEFKALSQSIRRLFWAIVATMDPSPYVEARNKIMLKTELEELRHDLSAEEEAEAYERLDWLCNIVVQAAWWTLPRRIRRQYGGDLGGDATPIRLFALGTGKKSPWASCDPDGGWYGRRDSGPNDNPDAPIDNNALDPDDLPKGGDRDRKRYKEGKAQWALDGSLLVTGSAKRRHKGRVPKVVIGMALDRPGVDPAGNMMRGLRAVARAGFPAGFLAADRGILPASIPEELQILAQELGYRLVFDYKIDQLGVIGQVHGAEQCEGSVYCPGMYKANAEATIDLREGKITAEDYQTLIDGRKPFLVSPHGAPGPDGSQRCVCPASCASGRTPTVACPLRPESMAVDDPTLPVVYDPPANPPKICTAGSVTIKREHAAKYRQDLEYKSTEWTETFRGLRNTIEGKNGTSKDGSWAALGDPGRRRGRGIAAASIYVAFLLFAENLRSIRNFYNEAEVDADGIIFRPDKRKTPRTWAKPSKTYGRRLRRVVPPHPPPEPDG